MALNSRLWAAACVRGPKHAYVGTLLGMQLGFQKHKKFKFFAIIAEVWNDSYTIRKLFQTPFFPLYKALHGIFSKHTEISWKKNTRFIRK